MESELPRMTSTRKKELKQWYIAVTRASHRPSNGEVRAYYQDKPHRMTPWGIQFNITGDYYNSTWEPSMPNEHHTINYPKICGKWIRDLPVLDPSDRFLDVQSSDLLNAFLHGEITDPELDIADMSNLDVPAPLTTACKITELPSEVLQQILSHTIPSGCTFQFFPARKKTCTARVSCVQKFVPELDPNFKEWLPHFRDDCYCEPDGSIPATGSAQLAIAATCQRLQEEAYSIFYAKNTFVFHLTTGSIRSRTRAVRRPKMRAWSRAIPPRLRNSAVDYDTGLGPLGTRAVGYLRNIILIPSLPPAPTTNQLDNLRKLITLVSASLNSTRLDKLTIDFQQPMESTTTGKRFSSVILTIDTLEATVSDTCELFVATRDPKVTIVRESNRAQQVLEPLVNTQGTLWRVKELVLSGSISRGMKERLEATFRKGVHAVDESADIANEERPAKKRKL